MNKQENTQKVPIFSMYQIKDHMVMVYNDTGSDIMIIQHCIGTWQDDYHSKHIYRAY